MIKISGATLSFFCSTFIIVNNSISSKMFVPDFIFILLAFLRNLLLISTMKCSNFQIHILVPPYIAFYILQMNVIIYCFTLTHSHFLPRTFSFSFSFSQSKITLFSVAPCDLCIVIALHCLSGRYIYITFNLYFLH